MQELVVSVDNNSFDSAGITKDSQDAICEFIWNALEASATRIDVSIIGADLTEAMAIVISDNGTGICHDNIMDTFGTFLSSLKKDQGIRIKTQTNKGKGRFSYLAMSASATWDTVYAANGHRYKYGIRLTSADKKVFSVTEITQDDSAQLGTTVTIPITDAKIREELRLEKIRKKLLEEFAWYLYLHKDSGITITYYGEDIDYSTYINTELSHRYQITIDNHDFDITIIVWQNRIDNSSKAYYLDTDGIIKGAENTRFNKNAVEFFHGVFVRSKYFEDVPVLTGADDDAALYEYEQGQRTIMAKLKKEIRIIIDGVLREYLLIRADEYLARDKTQAAFPQFSADEIGEAKRRDFQRVTRELYCVEPKIFYKLRPKQTKTMFGFIALLLDSDERENMLEIIEQIVDLTPEQRAKMVGVLKKTRLETAIEIIDILQQRYDVVYTLRSIVYDKDMARFANERDHIQRIVEKHYWLFGDQYSLVSADISVKRSLQEFEKMLGIENDADSVLSPEELRQRMDIVLYGSRRTESNQEEGLVVELKAPSVVLTSEVLSQIERYANQILSEPRFSGYDRIWKFFAICSRIGDDVKRKYDGYKAHNKPGLVSIIGDFEIYALSWDDVFIGFNRRYSFIAQKLKADLEAYQENNPDDTEINRDAITAKVDRIVNLSIAANQ